MKGDKEVLLPLASSEEGNEPEPEEIPVSAARGVDTDERNKLCRSSQKVTFHKHCKDCAGCTMVISDIYRLSLTDVILLYSAEQLKIQPGTPNDTGQTKCG